MKIKKSVLYLVLAFGVIMAGIPFTMVHSQGSLSSDINAQLGAAGAPSGLGNKDPRIIAAQIITVVLGLLGTIFLGLTVYAGYLWMTAGGEEEPITQAKSIIRNSVIGLGVVLMSYAITVFVFNGLVYSNYETGYTKTKSWVPDFQFKVLR